jgi:hypothetical protein
VEQEAERAGATTRTVLRWWAQARSEEVQRRLAGEDLPAGREALLRRAERGRQPALKLSNDDLAEIYVYATPARAFAAFRSDANHRFFRRSRSSMYDALSRTSPQVRAHVHKGHAAGRALEAHLPRTPVKVNERWSTDVYDLKVPALLPSKEVVQPKLLVIRDDSASGLPLSYTVVYKDVTAAATARAVGQAVVGWSYDGFEVRGPARVLWSDQGANLIARTVMKAAAHVGMGLQPTESYAPPANGGHEQCTS